ncbi:restriction endonuclease subunit S [Maridesulfovibrio frigidus]|uniref:restriction endonuclease subunit S n=1 Tax=Maridesulfovibrio frigidus TaxID=340956 RepID=UPI00068B89BA|nr:restriction endonuclease subunit S [Maridesulfovibrio frigidus]
MGSDWRKITVSELIDAKEADLQTGPFGTVLKAEEYSSTGVPLISVREIRNGFFELTDATPKIDEKTIARLPKYVLQQGDIVFGRKGGVERNALVNESQKGWFLGSDGIRLRLSPINDSRFISYQVRHPQTRLWLIQHAAGSTMLSLNQKILGRLPLVLPPLSVQKAIAHILGTLDDKIDLNRRMNETLEAMAQALFKSWFIDFDGCTEFEESELGLIPKGWRVGELGSISDILNGFAFKSKDYTETGTFVLRTKNFSNMGHVTYLKDDVYLPEIFFTTHEKYLCKDFDFFLVMVGASVGKTSTLYSNCLPAFRNQNMWCFRPKRNFEGRFYLNNTVKHIVKLNLQIASGSARSFFRKGDFKKFSILIPADSVIQAFENEAGAISQKISMIYQEIDSLANLRDTLLPKLISGEIRVGDAEKMVEEVL